MSNLIIVALVIIVVIIIAIIEFCALYVRAIKKNKKYAELLSESRTQTGELMKKVKAHESKEKVLKELIIFSQIGFDPTEAEKLKMIQNLEHYAKVAQDGINERKSYKTEPARRMRDHLDGLGTDLIDIYSSIQYALEESLSSNRSLYQDLLDYIYYFGFDFCGRHIDRKRRVVDF